MSSTTREESAEFFLYDIKQARKCMSMEPIVRKKEILRILKNSFQKMYALQRPSFNFSCQLLMIKSQNTDVYYLD